MADIHTRTLTHTRTYANTRYLFPFNSLSLSDSLTRTLIKVVPAVHELTLTDTTSLFLPPLSLSLSPRTLKHN